MIELYDYFSIYSNSKHESFISNAKFCDYFDDDLRFIRKSKFRYDLHIDNYSIAIQGIFCDHKGNYAFISDEEFSQINLIEVDIPQGAENFHSQLIEVGRNISSHFGWEVDWEN